MAEARIYYSGELDHTLRLAEGPNTFGSSLDCDVVLFDEAVRPVHFSITLDAAQAMVKPADGTELSLADEGGSVRQLEPGQAMPLLEAQVLIVGNTEIRLRDLPMAKAILNQAQLDRSRGRRLPSLGPSVAALTATVLGLSIYFGTPMSGVAVGVAGVVPPPLSERETADQPSHAADLSITSPEALAASLADAGFPPDSLRHTGTVFEAQFYVALPRDQEILLAHLAGREDKIHARVFVDTAFRRAAELAVSLSNAETPEIDVTAGHLVLRGAPTDADWRKKIGDTLQRDIPGLKSVSFEGRSEAWRDVIDNNLAAVWSGSKPYLVLTDGKKIRQGQNINEETVFRGIRDNSILLVTVNEIHEEYILK